MPVANANLHSAKRAKNDEFYTRLEDIEAEVRHYHDPVIPGAGAPKRNPFRGKVVYLNCDDPQWSNFWAFFALKFDELGIAELIATHYEPDGSPSYAMFLERDSAGAVIDHGRDERNIRRGRIEPLEGDGDFRSPECVALLERSDIVVTNPPFSLFREYIAQLMEHEKKFLVLGNVNAITYKEIFPLVKANLLWLGPSISSGDRPFRVPDEYPLEASGCWVDEKGAKWIRVKGVRWFTNLDHKKRHEEIDLVKRYRGNEHLYPAYDNYDAIEVSKVKDIPYDYDGVMGVPITFLDKFSPDQFEIMGISEQNVNGGSGSLWTSRETRHPLVAGSRSYARVFIEPKGA
ncbi:adenine-specific methyltransferase EcoRI family protein [Brachybacterium sp. JHP9]|uniref:Adenine-specific methyltransferase EcoRI family protein n=1 Tax=Brachybacterium equifaecis TaxID=2910770 RepID=A0ABT0R2Q8_9MICO|nr:adenine-specific methyltransferase EcoRI family protein [Brachybacterium equifaecis]MCL6423683.1 adenine-specific methyltransferase EcoRI family protein [Brachybacterium equifaecis]